jgi:hypothetical protein
MIDDRCQRYLEDPEANASHIEECAECRALQTGLDVSTMTRESTVDVNNLPLAPWEGASHRPWGLVLGGTLAVIVIALALCSAAGISPVTVADSSITSISVARAVIADGAKWFNQSLAWRLAFAAIFIVVNGLFIVLLRRAPRGVDV